MRQPVIHSNVGDILLVWALAILRPWHSERSEHLIAQVKLAILDQGKDRHRGDGLFVTLAMRKMYVALTRPRQITIKPERSTITDGYRCVARSQLRGVKLRLVFTMFNNRQANVMECSQVRGSERKIRVGRVVWCEHGRVHPNELRFLLCYRHLQL
jgi:hypothetical protein